MIGALHAYLVLFFGSFASFGRVAPLSAFTPFFSSTCKRSPSSSLPSFLPFLSPSLVDRLERCSPSPRVPPWRIDCYFEFPRTEQSTNASRKRIVRERFLMHLFLYIRYVYNRSLSRHLESLSFFLHTVPPASRPAFTPWKNIAFVGAHVSSRKRLVRRFHYLRKTLPLLTDLPFRFLPSRLLALSREKRDKKVKG